MFNVTLQGCFAELLLLVTFQVLYKLKTAKLFDPSKCRSVDDDDSPFAIQHIHLCIESRLLCIAGYTHVVLFRFSTQETSLECPVCFEHLYLPLLTDLITSFIHIKHLYSVSSRKLLRGAPNSS